MSASPLSMYNWIQRLLSRAYSLSFSSNISTVRVIELCQQKISTDTVDEHGEICTHDTPPINLTPLVRKRSLMRYYSPPPQCPESVEEAVKLREQFIHITPENIKHYRSVVKSLIAKNKIDELAALWIEEYWTIQILDYIRYAVCVAQLHTVKFIASAATSYDLSDNHKHLTVTELCKLAISHDRDECFLEFILIHMAVHFPALF